MLKVYIQSHCFAHSPNILLIATNDIKACHFIAKLSKYIEVIKDSRGAKAEAPALLECAGHLQHGAYLNLLMSLFYSIS